MKPISWNLLPLCTKRVIVSYYCEGQRGVLIYRNFCFQLVGQDSFDSAHILLRHDRFFSQGGKLKNFLNPPSPHFL
jgi:hypothetical protein